MNEFKLNFYLTIVLILSNVCQFYGLNITNNQVGAAIFFQLKLIMRVNSITHDEYNFASVAQAMDSTMFNQISAHFRLIESLLPSNETMRANIKKLIELSLVYHAINSLRDGAEGNVITNTFFHDNNDWLQRKKFFLILQAKLLLNKNIDNRAFNDILAASISISFQQNDFGADFRLSQPFGFFK